MADEGDHGDTAIKTASLPAALHDAARAPYRRCGRFTYEFAGHKIAGDPIYLAILERGLLQGRQRILDLGCGLGLLAATLRAAQDCSRRGEWPANWPAAPCAASIRGIELKAATAERARHALGSSADIVQGDIRIADFGTADAVAIVDVLQYIEADAHRAVLERVRQALHPAGLLLLRVGDADVGLRFRIGQCWDHIEMLARGGRFGRLHCRSATEWCALLFQCGFQTRVMAMSKGTPFANVLLCASPDT
ncbi:MAG: class I SAM-dependent methyltransferase [Steroidobacteraceae bacterium]